MLKIPIFKRLIPSLRKRLRVILNKRIFWTKINEIYFLIDIKDKIDSEFYFKKQYEVDNFNFILKNKFFKKNFIFLDVGCNSGIYSLNLLNCFNTCEKVFAFEPIIDTFIKFNQNVKKNNLQKKVESFNFALSNVDEKKKMKTIFKNNINQSAVFEISSSGNVNISSRVFDNSFTFLNKFIFLKCDTEGHEYEVLEGMKSNLMHNYFLILIEIRKKNYKKVSHFLKEINYQLIYKSKEQDSYFFGKV
ncbi:FkbM family methyltransferase [Pelagibacteraceae bacterium]|nr:FkbM family methyltransferase [Pelagibacteraceae bacterium]